MVDEPWKRCWFSFQSPLNRLTAVEFAALYPGMSRAWAFMDSGWQGPSCTGGSTPRWEFKPGSVAPRRLEANHGAWCWWSPGETWETSAEVFLSPHWRGGRVARQPGQKKEAADQVVEASTSDSDSGWVWPIEARREPQRHNTDVCEGAGGGVCLWPDLSAVFCRSRLLLARTQQGGRWAATGASGFKLEVWRWVGLVSVMGANGDWPLLDRLSWCSTALVAIRPATLVR